MSTDSKTTLICKDDSSEDFLTKFQATLTQAGEQAADEELRRVESKISKLLARFEWIGIELGGELVRYKAMLGVVRGCKGRWREFLRSIGLPESTARRLMNCHRQFGNEETVALLKNFGTLPTTIMKLAPPSIPQKARDEFLLMAKSQAVTPKEADVLIAKHADECKTNTTKTQPESVAIEGLGRIVLHPEKDADRTTIDDLKQKIKSWASEQQGQSLSDDPQ